MPVTAATVFADETEIAPSALAKDGSFSDKFFEQAKRLGRRIPHSVLWKMVASSRKHLGEKP
jgi:hypothetical protein